MAEVKYTLVAYCKYRSMELLTGVLLNTIFGFFVGMFSFASELDGSVLRWFMLGYGVFSVVYAGYAVPRHLLTLRWVTGRPETEVVEFKMLNPGTAVINGYSWDAAYWNKPEIVVDCVEGVAHIPYRSMQKGVVKS